ncbi:MAG: response regulator [Planctomycetaceae bacterium]|jgi:nitrogen-specific signal transduction histidine kinase/ActR/RegA family two-component response regulator|nr:response regulator [Planctomycetaceae bacterium]
MTNSDVTNSGKNTEITILSQVSHELKMPLSVILGYAEFITKQAGNLQECRNAASIILDNSDYLLQIIDNLLESGRQDNLSGKNGESLTIRNQQMDISRMIRRVYKLFSNSAAQKGLFFTVAYSTPIPRIIVTDRIRIRQILFNLISNAIKFTLSGGVRIILSWQKNNSSDIIFVTENSENIENTGMLKIDVCDSGIGISPDVLPRLFTPYQQADHTIKTCFGGTGLGLAISQKIANKLGGKIIVTNNLKAGSTFSFLLPVTLDGEVEFVSDPFSTVENCIAGEVVDNGENNVIESDSGVCDEFLLAGCRVLLVEDSEEMRRLWGLILEKAGAIITYAGDGESAFNFASNENYDVILMDVGLPAEDGYSVVRRLRNQGYGGQIVAVTADNSFESKEKSQFAGCNAFAAKPIFRNELIRIVKSNAASQKTKT